MTATAEDTVTAEADLERAVDLFCSDAGPTELRVLETKRGTVSGYFSSRDKLIAAARKLDGTGGVYVTLNPAVPEALARAANVVVPYAKHTTGDKEIAARRLLLVDLDPVRLSGIPSTDAEHDNALALARIVCTWLIDQRIPKDALVATDSGNGAAILVRVDLPNDDASRDLVKRLLATVDRRFSTATVKVDCAVFNAARITRLPGTLNMKGSGTADRPHRRARLLHVPDTIVICPTGILEAIAALEPEPAARIRPTGTGATGSPFNLPRWFADYGLTVSREKPWNGGTLYLLEACPFDGSHGASGEVHVGRHAGGGIDFGCKHNSCTGKTWHDVRALLEPGYRERRESYEHRAHPDAGQDTGTAPDGDGDDGEATAEAGTASVAVPHCTDLGNAQRLVRDDGERLRRADGGGSAEQVDGTAPGGGDAGTSAKRKRSIADKIIAAVLGTGVDLFHSPDGTAYATIVVDAHQETLALRSRDFRSWVERLYYAAAGSAPTRAAYDDALGVLSGRARYDGAAHTVSTRVAEHDGKIYLHLADADRRVVEIDREGWRLVAPSPVRFRLVRGMLPLPVPITGGSVSELRRYINVDTDADYTLMVAWLLAALRPRGPYPVLALHGEQGSAKSTTAKVLRASCDPNSAALRATPRDTRDLMIAALNGQVIAIDNLSHLTPVISDALCCLATGGGCATRALYTDDEEIIFSATRPVLLNGIEEIATRGDLLDRAIVLELPQIAEDKRRSEADVWRKYELAQPRILGALLDAVAGALRELPHTQLDRPPRMADFALWVTAAEPALGWKKDTFMTAYRANRGEAHELTIEASLVGRTLRRYLADQPSWTGTATELLHNLGALLEPDQRQDRAWPKSPRGLTGAILRVTPSLRQVGITIDHGRTPEARYLTITKAGLQPSSPSQPSPVEAGRADFMTVGDGGVTDDDGRPHRKTPGGLSPGDGHDGHDGLVPDCTHGVDL